MSSILVVEDDNALRVALRTSLTSRGYDVDEAGDGEIGVRAVADRRPDLVLLDLGLPGLDGVEVLRRIRAFSSVPVIVVTARDRQRDKVGALDAGADDYVTKPFDPEELAARIRAALRRAHDAPPEVPAVTTVGDVVIDLARALVTRAGERVPFTKTEFALLRELVANPGRLLTHEMLLQRVWGPEYGTETTYLRTYVGQIRKKLGDDAAQPRMIATDPGTGYRWIAQGVT